MISSYTVIIIIITIVTQFSGLSSIGGDGLFGTVPRSLLDDDEEYLRTVHEKSHDLVSCFE